MKRLIALAALLVAVSSLGLAAQGSGYMATTRWVAAIAELAGIGQVDNFAPSDMTHPPEYELSPADILELSKAKVVFAAGYEGKMVKKINEALASGGSFRMITVNTDNSPENLKAQAEKIAKEFGTMDACAKNLAAYGAAVDSARSRLKAKGLLGATALVHDYQTYLTKAFGFEIVGTFGPAPATPDQIAQAKKLSPAVIIDNYHNMVAKPLVEVSKGSRYATFLNFPGLFGTSSIVDVVDYNAKQLLEAAPGAK
jgi:ABC-type Zn uptake system ZnuABC Zn-binding protein ZnuA